MELKLKQEQGIANGKFIEGTLATLLTGSKKVASVGTNPNNMLNTKKMGFIELYNKADEYIGRVFVSATIKAELLAGTIQRKDLVNYPLLERVNPETEEPYYVITEVPTTIDKEAIEGSKGPEAKKVPTWKELLALANA